MANAELYQENLYINGRPYVIKKAVDTIAAAQTDDAFITGVTGFKIRIVALFLMCGDTATQVTFNTVDTGADTALVPVFTLGANGGAVLPLNPKGYFESANVDEGISVTTGAGSSVQIIAHYIEIA